MNDREFNTVINKCQEIASEIRKRSTADKSYLDRILYWTNSKIYMEGMREDICAIEEISDSSVSVLDFGIGIGCTSALLAAVGYQVEAIDTILDKSIKEIDALERAEDRQESLNSVWRELEVSFHNVSFSLYDGVQIPFESDTFDIVVAYAVLEHIPDVELGNILDEFNRVIKPEGLLCIFRLPRKWSISEHVARILKLGSHETLIDETEFQKRLTRHSFTTKQCSKQDMIPGFPPWLWNPAFPFWAIVGKVLLKTPLSLFAHHSRIVAQRSAMK